MNKQILAFLHEYEGACVGTIQEILEWCDERGCSITCGEIYKTDNKPIQFHDLIKDECK